MSINAGWHKSHPMPPRATMDQRVDWHLGHSKACGCRAIPATVLEELKRRRMMDDPLRQLKGGDRRSIGGVPKVVDRVKADPGLFAVVFGGMTDPDPIVRMRCADAIEKIAAARPEYLGPYKNRVIQLAATVEQQEVRWHLAQLVSRLKLSPRERRRVADILAEYLTDASKIVKTFSMQALADIAAQDADLRGPIVERLESLTRTGSPAMKSRGRKLLARLKKLHDSPKQH